MNDMMIRDRESLIAWIEGGGQPKYLYFWGNTAPRPGAVGKWCLSQWWPATFEVDDVAYPTVEHFMMAEKARLFGDEETRSRILAVAHPGEAKNLGRLVRDFDEETWERARFEIVVRGNIAKFGRNEPLREFLVNTSDRVLVEASPLDRIWGIGLAADDPRAGRPTEWLGPNLLGFALMETRERLRGDLM